MAYAELIAASNFFLSPRRLSPGGTGGNRRRARPVGAGDLRPQQFRRDRAGPSGGEGAWAAFRTRCPLDFEDGTPDIAAWPRDRAAYGPALPAAHHRQAAREKGACRLGLADLIEWSEGSELAVIPPPRLDADALAALPAVLARLTRRLRIACASPSATGWTDRIAGGSIASPASREARACPVMAAGDVLFHVPQRRPLADVLACIREHVTLPNAGRLLTANAERHMKSAAEMRALFRDLPEAVDHTGQVLKTLSFSLDRTALRISGRADRRPRHAPGSAGYADPGRRRAALSGRNPDGGDGDPAARVRIIATLDYARYFLTVHDIVRFARSRGILCQGRGSAAKRRSATASASRRSTRGGATSCSSASYPGAARTARHRRRLRARAARRGHPVHLRALRA